ncbi:glutaredoxin family protein [Filibacter tadaridae]|uniref:Glutaredoxin n=1 Tax=Filibacter tadaridae TaxID=2483811 RepID=A0A3P5WW09_9BACL|nr:glutaredoxin family protein [Filibacter tadaridae]VDC25975.1 hypothetical protein FILTAD_01391 [Filibacter tadaridae]
MHVNFYTRPGCHLCEEAKLMMKLVQEDYPLTWTDIDIETDDDSHEKYMLMIPVIEKDGIVLMYGSIGYADIIRLVDDENNIV